VAPQVFVDKVDVVSAPGYDAIRKLPAASSKYFEIRRVVTNLGVFDFQTDDNRMRIVSRHPGVTTEQIVDATTFELVIDGEVPESRLPTDDELRILREVIDPKGIRKSEFR
jgi:acyl CoA:acetate/3-ketoacid CoA transferase beta subunit